MATHSRGKYTVAPARAAMIKIDARRSGRYLWTVTRRSKGQNILVAVSAESFARTDSARRALRSLVKGIAKDLGLRVR